MLGGPSKPLLRLLGLFSGFSGGRKLGSQITGVSLLTSLDSEAQRTDLERKQWRERTNLRTQANSLLPGEAPEPWDCSPGDWARVDTTRGADVEGEMRQTFLEAAPPKIVFRDH